MLRFLRLSAAVVSIVAALALLAGDANARAGGGFSFGSRGARTFSMPPSTRTAPSTAPIQRSVTPRATTPSAGTGGLFGRPGGLFGGGLFGGLAAGFLGAGLFGMLFGHGFWGGIGGFASLLGFLIQIALVVVVARLAWAWWQRRNQPAFAGGPLSRDFGANDHGGIGGSSGSTFATRDAVEITASDYDAFERLLGEVQTAYSTENLNALNLLVTPEMLSYFSEELSRNASRGVVNQVSDVKLLQGDLAEAWREGNVEYATVAMRFSLVDRTIERASGRLVEGSTVPQEVTELWTFMRVPGGNWLLSAIQQA